MKIIIIIIIRWRPSTLKKKSQDYWSACEWSLVAQTINSPVVNGAIKFTVPGSNSVCYLSISRSQLFIKGQVYSGICLSHVSTGDVTFETFLSQSDQTNCKNQSQLSIPQAGPTQSRWMDVVNCECWWALHTGFNNAWDSSSCNLMVMAVLNNRLIISCVNG